MLDPLTIPATDQVFSWNAPEGGPTLHFAATRLYYAAASLLPVRSVLVEATFVRYCVRERGVEPSRLATCREYIRANWCEPVLFCHFENDNSHLLIDGTHRYVASFIEGRTYIPAYTVPEPMWREFLIDLPSQSRDEILGVPSGLS
jgi:hypothetical protein